MAKGISKIVAVIIVIVLLCYIAISGITLGGANIGPVFGENGIRKGFDLAGEVKNMEELGERLCQLLSKI